MWHSLQLLVTIFLSRSFSGSGNTCLALRYLRQTKTRPTRLDRHSTALRPVLKLHLLAVRPRSTSKDRLFKIAEIILPFSKLSDLAGPTGPSTSV